VRDIAGREGGVVATVSMVGRVVTVFDLISGKPVGSDPVDNFFFICRRVRRPMTAPRRRTHARSDGTS
jgi:hypothetical protein